LPGTSDPGVTDIAMFAGVIAVEVLAESQLPPVVVEVVTVTLMPNGTLKTVRPRIAGAGVSPST